MHRDEAVLTDTGIRQLRARPVFTTPNVFVPEDFEQATSRRGGGARRRGAALLRVQAELLEVHHFYDQLCPTCAELNFAKRTETADLRGRVALLTGGRVKIGYQAGIKLLRAGASLIVTTRFPRDAALRYSREADADDWSDRLEIYGLDLRHTPSVEALCHHLATTHDRLDYIVNNACQTVRRPPDFYRHMLDLETAALEHMPAAARALLGGVDGVRAPHLLGDGGAALAPVVDASTSRVERRPVAGAPAAGGHGRRPTCSRPGSSTRTSSRSTCGVGTRGGSRCPRCPPSSCSRRSSSTRWRRSC